MGMAASLSAATYSEALNGDLSNNWLAPSTFVLDQGLNTLTGTVSSSDRDYVTFTILAGYILEALTLEDYSSASGLSFIGIQSGTTFTEPPTGTDVANLLGYAHFGPAVEGMDILPEIGTGAGAAGFIPPLSAGSYTLWIQETGGATRGYTFSLEITAVPEPAAWLLLAGGAGALALAKLRRVI